MIIECPAPGCAHRLMGSGAVLGFVGGRIREASTVTCRNCGQVIQLGLLILDDDEIWRVSRFAGHADDVRLSEPPGGDVSYEPVSAPEAGEATAGLAEGELRARQRALSTIDGKARESAPERSETQSSWRSSSACLMTMRPPARSWLRRE